MYTCKFYILQDCICPIVIIYIVLGFMQTQPHAFNKLLKLLKINKNANYFKSIQGHQIKEDS